MMPETGRLGRRQAFRRRGDFQGCRAAGVRCGWLGQQGGGCGEFSGGVGPDRAGHRPEELPGRHGQDRRYLLFPVNDLEAVSQQVQKDLPFSRYHPPALVGIGAGAALAYAVRRRVAARAPSRPASDWTSARSIWRRARSAPMRRRRLPTRGRAVPVRCCRAGCEDRGLATAKAGCPADLMEAVMDHTPRRSGWTPGRPVGRTR